MKKLLIIITLLISTSAFANNIDVYRIKMVECDNVYDSSLNKNFKDEYEYYSSAKSLKIIDALVSCYDIVSRDIIDAYYKKDSKIMKENLEDLKKYSARLAGNIYMGSDACYNKQCGKEDLIMAKWPEVEIYRLMVKDMINVILSKKDFYKKP